MITQSNYDNAHDVTDKAGRSLDRALESGQAAARRASERASELASRGLDAVRDGSQQLRDRALRVTDDSVQYIKHEPVKSMLYAAVAGAALMGIVSLLSRRRY
ncbi:MAG: hypothetical protein ABIR94_10015 [Rubrivivax sp.]